MFCGHCGAENPDNVKFCTSCGKPIASGGQQDPQPPPADAAPAEGSPYVAPPPGSAPPPPPPPPGGSYLAGSSSGPYRQVPNTSGMGGGQPMPPESQNYNWAGCLPCGIFAFMNGAMMWGLITVVASFFVGSLASLILVIKGNEFAWQHRRFDSIQQFRETMDAWNYWGRIYFFVSLVLSVLGFVAYFFLVFWMIAQDASTFDSPPPPPGGF